MNIVVIIQARMGSTRLPGKVMLNLIDRPILAHVVNRCQLIASAQEVMIATTNLPADDPIASYAKQANVRCYRGSETNVLDRYYEAAKAVKADLIVRVTSDCPLLDPEISDAVIRKFLEHPNTDYCSNVLERSFPQGLDTEVFTFAALEKAHREASLDYEWEHVTPYINRHPELFQLSHYTGDTDYSSYRWTVDTPEDYRLVEAIYTTLYKPGETFSWRAGIALMEERPELVGINGHIRQKKLGE